MAADADPPTSVRPMHVGRLVLTAADPHLCPEIDLLADSLSTSGLLGARLGDPSLAGFRVGPGFFGLVAFTGCAVSLETEPNGSAPFCHIRFSPPSEHPRPMVGRNTRPPRCPGCRARLTDWRERAPYWSTHHHAGVICPGCGETRPPWLWDWKHQGGFGRFFIQIEEVFPGEAMPTAALFDLLIRSSGVGWRHFYIQDEISRQPPSPGQS